jgi:phosphoenolpyruvate carboxylase
MSKKAIDEKYKLLNPQPEHFVEIQELCKKVYPFSKPWSIDQLESHRSYFPDGQLIVIDVTTGKVVGMAFSLIVFWDDYLSQDSWKDFTSSGFFHNHNPQKGKTLYGAEVMVDPELRGLGIGKMLYQGRLLILEKYGLMRIRAGARLRGYGKFHEQMTPDVYVRQVSEKKIYDPTLSFQISQGFKVIDVAPNYLFNDPESLGYAAVIEWLNPKMAKESDYKKQSQSTEALFSGNKFVSEHLPRELRRLVRKALFVLGDVIKEYEGDKFFDRIEHYRHQLKKTRGNKNQKLLTDIMKSLKTENNSNRLKIAHSFSLQLELVNVCEAAYRTWRQHLKPVPQGVKSKLNLTYVLTAHPTEARSKNTVEVLNALSQLLLEALQSDFLFNENELMSCTRMLWLQSFSKLDRPSVIDEAEYIYSLVFSEELFDFILKDKPSYDLKLRTWVGGDKDGHPNVNKSVMLDCFNKSRVHLLRIVRQKIEYTVADAFKLEQTNKFPKNDIKDLRELLTSLNSLETITSSDGTRVKAWAMKYQRFLKKSENFIKKHNQIQLLSRLLEIFPALVFPIELREDSDLIKAALVDKNSLIRGMISELKNISGALGINAYARGLVISHCESAEDISQATQLIQMVSHSKTLPAIPLFETKEALLSSKKIIKKWLSTNSNSEMVKRQWNSRFEIMLGYSDSSKQSGVLPSRYLIAKAMTDIEKAISKHSLRPQFFHGSGGSVARGGGSLKEQIAWWPNSAIASPKLTIQGEMIQRKFSSKEILHSECIHFANEALRRKRSKVSFETSPELERFVNQVNESYTGLIQNEGLLKELLEASPYHYLDVLKIGSRPSKRPQNKVSVDSLRAIPWILCWTQTRLLMPTWWGVGTAWKNCSPSDKKALITQFKTNPFLSSFIKTLGFTLSKVELEIWQLYFREQKNKKLFEQFQFEYENAIKFVLEISQEKELIWYRLWLKESIKLRSANIHILNMLQILSFESNDEALLRETIVGIACGMLTTG